MFTPEEHVDNLVRHISLVRENCLRLGKRLMQKGRVEFARILIANGHVHDASKWHGVEWLYLHMGKDTPAEQVKMAVCQHQKTNPHHPEYWGGIDNMPEIYVAEMVCDWYARSTEFGKDLRNWVNTQAVERFQIKSTSEQWTWINTFLDMLLEDTFVKE